MTHLAVTRILILAVASTAACGPKRAPETLAPVPPAPSASSESARAEAGGGRPVGMAGGESGAAASRRAALEARIRFDYNQFDLTPEAQSILAAKAEVLKAEPAVTLQIEGHADERGSDEYNLVLSRQRSAAAKAYLVSLGVAAARLETVGFGEERPLQAGSTEEAWAENRRAEFRITAGFSSN